MHHIQEAGFEGVIRCGYIQLDHGLITALVERWRLETHTFHFPIGEATITLQDVEVLWGLQVMGSPVCAADMNKSLEEWIDICETMMGFTPLDGAISNNRILLRWNVEFGVTRVLMHVLPAYRDAFASLQPNQMDGMCRVFYTSLDLMSISDAKHAGYFAQIRDIASHYMHQARGHQRLDIRHSHVLEQVGHQSSLTQQIHREPRNVQRGSQGGRRCRTQPTQSHFSNIGLGVSSSNFQYGSHSDTTLPTQTPTVYPSPITPIQLFDQTLDSGITNDNAHNGGSSQLQVNDNELDEQNDITVEHHGDLPIALRKQKRTVKHIGCVQDTFVGGIGCYLAFGGFLFVSSNLVANTNAFAFSKCEINALNYCLRSKQKNS
ncbi:hypothetical protein ZIOFF_004615 [Zingiber officinale]|uniref:Aminotransferase-like plant mobile domain-containing protein n=1 Tax=Zingiber officinale TaxID=94328 RepID=A0A8J5IB33_ZINOF|nr:hypothetical protein ZIOFF_004615 [Zingiber officinale]